MAVLVQVKAYASPTLVLLAFNWDAGKDFDDFLGFAIKRSPGFSGKAPTWLPNRLGFQGGNLQGDFPSNEAPIQKFMWWDARIDDNTRGKSLTYNVTPIRGTPDNLQVLSESTGSVTVKIPQPIENGIGTWFNRAVVSSQAFTREFGTPPLKGDKADRAKAWLANGMQDVVPKFLKTSGAADAAIYHLSDPNWIIPALDDFDGPLSIVYYYKAPPVNPESKSKGDLVSDNAVKSLAKRPNVRGIRRTKTSIMHDKFIVRRSGGSSLALMMGSANFTEEGITSQANLMHTFDSPELAQLYETRFQLLEEDPTKKATQQRGGQWSEKIHVGDADIRVFFAPEPNDSKVAIGTIVEAVQHAQASVIFCVFDPTDDELLTAMFQAGSDGKMMFGLVNKVPPVDPATKDTKTVQQAAVDIYHRSKENKDVYGYGAFRKGSGPAGFSDEPFFRNLKGPTGPQNAVFVHHKFVVIDAETDSPAIYTGSPNLSKNSTINNDENLLEITGSPRLAAIYLAEFMRLYEHYRARAIAQDATPIKGLAATSEWAKNAYTPDTPEFKSRIRMVR
jgi:phosphatidylserine/phosphatidylglycerophosphate/cardiolipin synthase-like enzyme